MDGDSARPPGLARALGLHGLTFFGVGQILGAGIYSVIGAAAGLAGEAVWLSFLVATVAALLTGLSYAELTTAFPQAGAEYVYVRQAFPRWSWAPFATGVVIIASGAATAATVALAFGGYLEVFARIPPPVAAACLLALLTLLNIAGIRHSTWANVAFTLIELSGLVIVIVLGISRPGFGDALLARAHPGVLAGAALVFFAYLGFEDIANLAEEARNPARDLPRAIFISLAVTTTLYVLVGLASIALASPQRLAASASPLAVAVAAAAPRLRGLIGAVALFATANTALITLIVGSRMLYAMGRDGDLPASLERTLPVRRTPWIAALTMFAIAAVLVPFRSVAVVASLSSFGALIAFTAVHGCLVALRYGQPERPRPFRVPITIGRMPVLPLLGILIAVALLLQFSLLVYIVGFVVFVTAVVVFTGRRRWG